MPVVQLGQPVVFRPGTAHEERWGPGQFLSGMVTSVVGEDASLIVWPAGEYPPYYELRVKRDDALSTPRTWTPSVSEDTEMPEAPADGLIYGRRNQAWTPVSGTGQGAVQSIIISDTLPIQALEGMAWLDTTINNFFIFFQGRWVEPAHVNPVEDLSANIIAPFISGTVSVDSVLSCTSGDWTNNPLSYAYQWYRGPLVIAGATTNLHTIILADVGFDLTCTVTATNKLGVSQPATSNIISVKAPFVDVPPSLNGTVAIGGILLCNPGAWKGPLPIGFNYQWKRDGVIISGATTNTYTIVAGDTNTDISCTVTATNSIGSTSAESNAISIEAPIILTAPVVTGPANTGAVITCTSGTWAGIPTSYAYQWMRDGVNIAGAVAAGYVVVAADENKVLSCKVTATNGIGASAPATSNLLSVGIPVNTVAPFIDGDSEVVLGEVWTCTTGTWLNPPLTYQYQWLRQGIGIPGETQSTHIIVPEDKNASISCTVYASNLNGLAFAQSNSIVIDG